MRKIKSKNPPLFLLLIMIIAAFLLRIYRLGLPSLWEDEITRILNSTIYAQNFKDVVQLASVQSQPPLSYWLNRVFLFGINGLGIGFSDFLVRIPSVIYGVITVPIFFLLVRDWFGAPYDLFATLIFVISPLSIRYSQEVGPISLWLFVTVVESYLLVKAVKKKQTIYWIFTCLSMIVSIYTHIFAAFVIGLQIFALMIYYMLQRIFPELVPNEIKTRSLVFAFVCSLIAAISFLFILGSIYSGSTRYIQGLEMSATDFGAFVVEALVPLSSSTIGLFIITMIVLIGLLEGIRQKKLEGMLLIVMVLGFPIVEYIAFVFQGLSYFQSRYVIAALPFFIIAFILGVVSVSRLLIRLPLLIKIDKNLLKQWSLLGSMILIAYLSIPALRNVYLPTKQNWRGLTQFLDEELDANDVLIFSPEYISQYYNYYNKLNDRDRSRYAIPEESAFLDDIYWVTKDNSSEQFNELPVKPHFIKGFSNNIYLWKWPVQEYLNSIQLANQDFLVKIPDGVNKNWPVGWAQTGSKVSFADQNSIDSNTPGIKFYVEDKDAGLESLPIPTQPNREVMLNAEVKTEQLNQFGVIVSLIIQDQAGNIIAIFNSDAVGDTNGWLYVTAGGIVPADGDSMMVSIRNVDVPKKNASVSLRNIQVYSNGSGDNKIKPIQQVEIPDFYNQVQVNSFWNFSDSQKENVKFSLDNEVHGTVLSLETVGPDANYLLSSPKINIEVDTDDYIFFGVDVKTENLKGDIGFEIAIGWIDNQGKTIKWSESQRLTGTNGWQQLWIAEPIPRAAVQLRLIPISLFDSQDAGEKIWISNPVLFVQGDLTIPNSKIENYQAFNLPDIVTMLDTHAQDGFWRFTATNLVLIGPDQSDSKTAELAGLRFVTNGSNADFMMSSPRIPIEESAGANFVFKVDLRSEGLAGKKGVEIAIGWFDRLGKNIGWSESHLIKGTNDWNTIQVIGSVPEDAVEMTIVPLRIFDSRTGGERVWIKNVRLFIERGE
jgi:mannosyltransferase